MSSITNVMNMTATPSAVPIPIATLPVFKHLYIVKEKRCAGCYEEIFKIHKTQENWIVERKCDNNNKKFSIPVHKLTEDIINILIMLGLERTHYKIELIQNDEIIKSNKIKNITNAFNHIMKTEQLLIGVYYDKIN